MFHDFIVIPKKINDYPCNMRSRKPCVIHLNPKVSQLFLLISNYYFEMFASNGLSYANGKRCTHALSNMHSSIFAVP